VGEWRTVISADELNGWLATKLPEAFPELLPKSIRDPRVAITPDAVFLAAQSTIAGVDTVVSVEVEPFVTTDGDFPRLPRGSKCLFAGLKTRETRSC
jgi:hypothetical protein